MREVASQGEVILFVGTKKQAQEAIKEEAIRANMFFVNERWLGGMLTNFKTIETRIKRLKQLEAMAEDGTFEVLPKKEVIGLRHEMEKLEKYLGGIKDMPKMPGALFVVDPKKEKIAIAEAKKLGIPVVATVDQSQQMMTLSALLNCWLVKWLTLFLKVVKANPSKKAMLKLQNNSAKLLNHF